MSETPEEIAARTAIRTGMPVRVEDGEIVHPTMRELRQHEKILRANYERNPRAQEERAWKGHFPPAYQGWQMPWELRQIECFQEAVRQSDPEANEDEEEILMQACQIAMMGTLADLADDLVHGLPWYRRLFLSRARVEREIEARILRLV